MNTSGPLQGTTYSQAACAFDHLYINDFIGIASRASLQSLLVIKKPTYFDPSRIQSKPVQNYLELSMIWTCSMETHAFKMEVYVVRICIYAHICTFSCCACLGTFPSVLSGFVRGGSADVQSCGRKSRRAHRESSLPPGVGVDTAGGGGGGGANTDNVQNVQDRFPYTF